MNLMRGGEGEVAIKVVLGFLSNELDGPIIYSDGKKEREGCEGFIKSFVWGVQI